MSLSSNLGYDSAADCSRRDPLETPVIERIVE